MPAPKTSDDEFIGAWHRFGGRTAEIARFIGVSEPQMFQRRRRIEGRYGIKLEAGRRQRTALSGVQIPARQSIDLRGCVALAISDAHFWLGVGSAAFDALLQLGHKLKPHAIIDCGDSMDGASISRHPMLGYDDLPSVADELQALESAKAAIKKECKAAHRIWTPGNHDERFDRYLANNAPKMDGVDGMTLFERFPDWKIAWAFEVNWKSDPLLVLHNWKGGKHASHNNAAGSMVHMLSGHDHGQKASPITTERGTLWGINPGTLADVEGPQFRYVKGRPKDWRSGFSVLTFDDSGCLLPPEFCTVQRGRAYFRGAAL